MTDIPTLPDTIRLLTLNVLSPSHAYWPRRRNLLRDCLSALRPDVVALQEVVWGMGTTRSMTCLARSTTWRRTRPVLMIASARSWPVGSHSAL